MMIGRRRVISSLVYDMWARRVSRPRLEGARRTIPEDNSTTTGTVNICL